MKKCRNWWTFWTGELKHITVMNVSTQQALSSKKENTKNLRFSSFLSYDVIFYDGGYRSWWWQGWVVVPKISFLHDIIMVPKTTSCRTGFSGLSVIYDIQKFNDWCSLWILKRDCYKCWWLIGTCHTVSILGLFKLTHKKSDSWKKINF